MREAFHIWKRSSLFRLDSLHSLTSGLLFLVDRPFLGRLSDLDNAGGVSMKILRLMCSVISRSQWRI